MRDAFTIRKLGPDAPELAVCARWRFDAFMADGEISFEESWQHLIDITSDHHFMAAFCAIHEGQPVGFVMLVDDELEPRHRRTPWLASLIVPEAARNRGIGRALVVRVERHAAEHGFPRVYLYTGAAEAFYARLGWNVEDRFDWDGEPFVLMGKTVPR